MARDGIDTSVEVDAVLVSTWRTLSHDARLAVVEALCHDVEVIAVAGIRRSMPGASPREVRHELTRRRYGRAVADAAFAERRSSS